MTKSDCQCGSISRDGLHHPLDTAGVLQIIAVPNGHGAGDARTARGPEALLRAGLVGGLERQGWRCRIASVPVASGGPAARQRDLASVIRKLARCSAAAASAHVPFLALGGDHAMAMGTWSGVAQARRSDGALGLIWIDAHLDAHTPATTPSGNRHGMPMAYLLGCGDDALRHLAGSRPALRPQNVCIVGVRSCERQEAALLRRLGVRVIGDDEIARIGVEAALRSAMEIVRRGTIGFGVSLDLDAIDPVDAPGVGTPVAGGIPARALSAALEGIGRQPGFVGLELVEYNPDRDRDGRTARIAVDLARGVFRIKSGHHA